MGDIDLTVITCEKTTDLPKSGVVLSEMPESGVVYVFKGHDLAGHPWKIIMRPADEPERSSR